jgi:ABC-type Fe3+-hydroxamate transport system substrate-binding protein
MNVKETMEMIAYLKEKREDAAQMRNYYQERLAKVTEEGSDEQKQVYLKGEASKSGIEVSRLDYFIRILEQIEVTR